MYICHIDMESCKLDFLSNTYSMVSNNHVVERNRPIMGAEGSCKDDESRGSLYHSVLAQGFLTTSVDILFQLLGLQHV